MPVLTNLDVDFKGRGYPKVRAFVPQFGGKLYAAHWCGSTWDGAGAAGDDWSGNIRNLDLNGSTVNAVDIEGVSSTLHPVTPFSTNDLVGDADDVVILGVFYVPATAPITSLFNSGGTAPYIALLATPNSNKMTSYVFDLSGSTSVDLTWNPEVENRYAIFGSRWSKTSMQPFYVLPSTGALVKGTATSHSRGLSGSGRFHSLSATAPHVRMSTSDYYRGALADADILSVCSDLRKRVATVGVSV
jgi:hypothetical protein